MDGGDLNAMAITFSVRWIGAVYWNVFPFRCRPRVQWAPVCSENSETLGAAPVLCRNYTRKEKRSIFFWQLEIKSSLKNLAHISRQCGRNLALNFTQQLNNRRWMQAWTFPRPRCSIPVQISILYRQRLMPGSRPFLDSPRSGTQD